MAQQGGRRMQSPGGPAPKRKKSKRWIWWIVLLAVVLAALALVFVLRPAGGGQTSPVEEMTEETDLPAQEEPEPEEEPEEIREDTQEETLEEVPDETPDEAREEPLEDTPEEPDQTEERVSRILSGMTLREKVLQLFVVTPEQLTGVDGPVTRAGDATRAALEACPVGGIIYFADNLVTRDQVIQMLTDIQGYAPLGLFLAVDEEGGTVSRVGSNASLGGTKFPSMGTIGAGGDPQEAYQVGYTIGSDLDALGFNLDFAPVADVNSNPENPVIGNRAFSGDASVAAEMVEACVEGFRDSGTLCTLKHFPGHGDTATDSHLGTAVSEKTLEELEECEFLPFRSGIAAGADFVMVGHISLPNVTGDDTPATLSPEIVTGLLREELGFEGVIITDSMQMGAITDRYTSGQAAVLALQAGVDMILEPASLEGALEGVLSAVEEGTLTQARIEESVARILTLKLELGLIPD